MGTNDGNTFINKIWKAPSIHDRNLLDVYLNTVLHFKQPVSFYHNIGHMKIECCAIVVPLVRKRIFIIPVLFIIFHIRSKAGECWEIVRIQ